MPSRRWPPIRQYHPADDTRPDRDVDRPVRDRVPDGGVQIVVVGAQPGEPFELVGTDQVVARGQRQIGEVRAVRGPSASERSPASSSRICPYARIVSSIR